MPFIDLTFLLSVALLVYAWWPGCAGRGRWTGRLLALVLLSPVLRYGSALFLFPIRLQFSAWAGRLLQLAGVNIEVEGNVLLKQGVEMAVDPACMGLQMTGISVLFALFALIWQERQAHRTVPLGWVVLYGGITFGLTILCNLFRIVLLVLFEAMPDTPAHELIGLVCVACYAWFPAWMLTRVLVRTVGQPEASEIASTWVSRLKSAAWGLSLLVVGSSILAFSSRPVKPTTNLCQAASLVTAGWQKYGVDYRCKTLSNGFVQLSKPGVLIYLKPQPDWFSADHSPMACWQGSGYELRRIREVTLNGHPAYAGELRKKGKILYTAWWFSNGSITTVSQLTMRGQMLRGETGFVLVNVTVDKNTYQTLTKFKN